MKFKELLAVLDPYTDINLDTDESIFYFETSKLGLLEGNHQKYYNEHKDWNVIDAYPEHSDYNGSYMVVSLEESILVHVCFFEAVEGDDIHDYCMECGDSIFKP